MQPFVDIWAKFGTKKKRLWVPTKFFSSLGKHLIMQNKLFRVWFTLRSHFTLRNLKFWHCMEESVKSGRLQIHQVFISCNKVRRATSNTCQVMLWLLSTLYRPLHKPAVYCWIQSCFFAHRDMGLELWTLVTGVAWWMFKSGILSLDCGFSIKVWTLMPYRSVQV